MGRLFALALFIFLGACAPVTAPVPPATSAPTVFAATATAPPNTAAPVSTATSAPVIIPTSLPTTAPTQIPTPVCPALQAVCILDGHFLLQRPIAAPANNTVDHSYRYGSTQDGAREPHHGVEFPNAQGTPVLAAADGVVVFAGSDKSTALAWIPGYYGNVVVIEHHFAGLERAVYSLYAHQFKINVKVGQRVSAGEQIGQVGATGIAIGSHLHFEVRLGADDYRSNRNPELWLAPLAGMGVLAGRIQTPHGEVLTGTVNIQRIENGVLNPLSVAAVPAYITNEAQPVQADDSLHESFAIGELPAGEYRLTLIYNGTIYEQVVKIEPARLTFVKFFVK